MTKDAENSDSTVIVHDTTDGAPPSPIDTPLGDVKPDTANTLDGSAALDNLLKEAGGDPASPDAPLKEEVSEESEKADAAAKLEADKKAAEEAAKASKLPEEGVKPTVEEPKDQFSGVQLPPHTKPASAEAFNKLKALAREENAKLAAHIEELKKQVPVEGSSLSPEVKKELDDLRAFRAVHDYQNSTEFKATYEAPLQANNEAILVKLKAAGYTDEHIAKIKSIGVEKLDWEPVLENLNTVTRRAIEAKLLENESILEKKAAAVAAAQKAPEELTQKQQREQAAAQKKEADDFTGTVNSILQKVEWSKLREVPATATAVEKAAIEKHNTFAKEQEGRRAILLADASPQMRGTLVASTLLAYQFKREAEEATARAVAAEEELAKIKKASSTSRRSSQAPGAGLPVKGANNLQSGKDALAEFEKAMNSA